MPVELVGARVRLPPPASIRRLRPTGRERLPERIIALAELTVAGLLAHVRIGGVGGENRPRREARRRGMLSPLRHLLEEGERPKGAVGPVLGQWRAVVGEGIALGSAVHRRPQAVVVAVAAPRGRRVAGAGEVGGRHEAMLGAGDRSLDHLLVMPRLLGEGHRALGDPSRPPVGGDEQIPLRVNDEVTDVVAGEPAWPLPVAEHPIAPFDHALPRPEPHSTVGRGGNGREVGDRKSLGTGEKLPRRALSSLERLLTAPGDAGRRGDDQSPGSVVSNATDIGCPPHQPAWIPRGEPFPRATVDPLKQPSARRRGHGAVSSGNLTYLVPRRHIRQILAVVARCESSFGRRLEPSPLQAIRAVASAEQNSPRRIDPDALWQEPLRQTGGPFAMERHLLEKTPDRPGHRGRCCGIGRAGSARGLHGEHEEAQPDGELDHGGSRSGRDSPRKRPIRRQSGRWKKPIARIT